MHEKVRKGKLVLKDGSVFEGTLYGGKRNAVGEVVFTTGMSGYQETLTDPSFCGQIVVMTYPLVGNYGCNPLFNQGKKCFFQGFVIGELCDCPSNWRNEQSLEDFLIEQDIPTLAGVDTRAITRKIRNHGVLQGVIVPAEMPDDEVQKLLDLPAVHNQVEQVTTPEVYTMGEGKLHVAVMDFGIKRNILKSIEAFGCRLTVFPASATAEEVLACDPDGIFLSNGPGDPKDLPEVIENIKKLIGKKPIFGICLGHQAICEVYGATIAHAIKLMHGKKSDIIVDTDKKIFNGLPKVVEGARYHSLIAKRDTVPDTLEVIAEDRDGEVMGVKHKNFELYGLQFHPESILTSHGMEMIKNFITLCK